MQGRKPPLGWRPARFSDAADRHLDKQMTSRFSWDINKMHPVQQREGRVRFTATLRPASQTAAISRSRFFAFYSFTVNPITPSAAFTALTVPLCRSAIACAIESPIPKPEPAVLAVSSR